MKLAKGLIVCSSALLVAGTMLAVSPMQPDKQPATKPPATQPADKKPDAKPDAKPEIKPAAKEDAYVLGFKMKRIDGKEEDLSTYKGKVIIMVNVASKCGFTAQYEALEKLYQDNKDKGLVILGFPANDFKNQEPATNSEIAEFCSSKHGVTFPLFEKISVTGKEQHELYKKLAAQPAPIGGNPKWNFTKFVVDKDGKVVAHFDAAGEKGADGKTDLSKLEPDLIKKVHELLGVKEEKTVAPKPVGS